MGYVYCRDSIYCEEDDISGTKSDFRCGDDTRYWCKLDNKMVYENDSCSRGEE